MGSSDDARGRRREKVAGVFDDAIAVGRIGQGGDGGKEASDRCGVGDALAFGRALLGLRLGFLGVANHAERLRVFHGARAAALEDGDFVIALPRASAGGLLGESVEITLASSLAERGRESQDFSHAFASLSVHAYLLHERIAIEFTLDAHASLEGEERATKRRCARTLIVHAHALFAAKQVNASRDIRRDSIYVAHAVQAQQRTPGRSLGESTWHAHLVLPTRLRDVGYDNRAPIGLLR